MAAAAALLEMQRNAASWTFDTEEQRVEAVARAKAATSGDPLRVAYIAWQQVEELECRNRRFEAHLLQAAAGEASARQAVREELDRLGLPDSHCLGVSAPVRGAGLAMEVGEFAGAFEDDPEGGTSAAQALDIDGDLAGIFDSPKVAAAADSDRGAGLMLDDDVDSISPTLALWLRERKRGVLQSRSLSS